jgi:hypothetical protein
LVTDETLLVNLFI